MWSWIRGNSCLTVPSKKKKKKKEKESPTFVKYFVS